MNRMMKYEFIDFIVFVFLKMNVKLIFAKGEDFG